MPPSWSNLAALHDAKDSSKRATAERNGGAQKGAARKTQAETMKQHAEKSRTFKSSSQTSH